MLKALRRILFLLIAFALIGGTTSELAHSAQHTAPVMTAGMPCDMAMPAAGSSDNEPMAPCKGMTSDCIKLMGCVMVTALPARFTSQEAPVRYSTVDYWTAAPLLVSLDREPEPLPPRTI
jgi:hypothetical protein